MHIVFRALAATLASMPQKLALMKHRNIADHLTHNSLSSFGSLNYIALYHVSRTLPRLLYPKLCSTRYLVHALLALSMSAISRFALRVWLSVSHAISSDARCFNRYKGGSNMTFCYLSIRLHHRSESKRPWCAKCSQLPTRTRCHGPQYLSILVNVVWKLQAKALPRGRISIDDISIVSVSKHDWMGKRQYMGIHWAVLLRNSI